MRASVFRLLWIACLGLLVFQSGAATAHARSAPLRFAWLRDGHARLWQFDGEAGQTSQPLAASLNTPLGSVWKLFVYVYLVDRKLDTPDYDCEGTDPEDVYCCAKGGRIDRDRALVQSCGPYFLPARLHLDPTSWRHYWTALGAPRWLSDLARLGPATDVPVYELLRALSIVTPRSRQLASSTLVSVLTTGIGEGTVSRYGSLLRVKTWTMPDPKRPGASMGGAAGWLADGTPVWLSGSGASPRVLARAADHILPLLARAPVADDGACVVVHFFTRYPVREVLSKGGDTPAAVGLLRGRYRVGFENGNWLSIESRGDLMLDRDETGRLQITGRFGLNDYVARVVEREGSVTVTDAARALAVAARSYVVERAVMQRGCFVIDDSSATQRVLPRPPTQAARRVADWTDALVLVGANIQYRRDQAQPGQMSWRSAQDAALQGLTFDSILARTWPQAMLTSFESPLSDDCQAIAGATQWLRDSSAAWEPRLQALPGYEKPPLPAVCAVRMGRPYADTQRNRIYIYRLQTEEDRIALAHEYLHLAFAHYPLGLDESFIERTARALIRTDGALQ